MTYIIKFRFDLGKAIAPVEELVNGLNSSLARMGYDEEITITSELPALTLQVNRELTDEEETQVKKVLVKQFQAAFPKWNVRLASFSRKPGNVQQSVSQ